MELKAEMLRDSALAKVAASALILRQVQQNAKVKKYSREGQGSLQLNISCFFLSCLWMMSKYLEGSAAVWLGCGKNKAIVQGGISFSAHWGNKFFIGRVGSPYIEGVH